jgi:signal transduction histidine kinase
MRELLWDPGASSRVTSQFITVKPKPHSIQHRFVLLQGTLFALALWFLGGALFFAQRIRRDLVDPFTRLRSMSALQAGMGAARENLLNATLQGGPAGSERFEKAAGILSDLGKGSSRLPLRADERLAVESAVRLQEEMIQHARAYLNRMDRATEENEDLAEVRRLSLEITGLLHGVALNNQAEWRASDAQLQKDTRRLYIVLGGFGLMAVFALAVFRRVHRREIWEPLEVLRQMVLEVQRGNLNPQGRIPNTVEFGTLVTGFHEMAEELRRRRESLEEQVRERTAELESTQRELIEAAKLASIGDLVSGVAHEVNNPLTTILGFAELDLARPELDQRLRRHLQTIKDESIRLKALVTNLSNFARRAPQLHERFDLRQALGRMVDLRKYQLSVMDITLHFSAPPEPIWVLGDKDHLVQVFFNLVLNAEHAVRERPGRGDIWLECGVKGDRAWAAVLDNGAGIPARMLEGIFEPFVTTRPAGQGSGLGLSISRNIIRQHKGTITAESSEGQGSAFRISLPLTGPPETAAPSAPGQVQAPVAAPIPRGLRALVIDDETSITDLMSEFLRSIGWECTVLNNSAKLETQLDSHQFDIVLCDLKMPRRNGIEVLHWLRNHRPKLARRFLLMTGNLADTPEKDTAEVEALPVLRKPFTLDRLREALNKLLATPSE